MLKTNISLLSDVADYYSQKLSTFGDNHRGVDWNSEEGQQLRFEQLSKIIQTSTFTINDFGCGYGAYYDHLKALYPITAYTGIDITQNMIEKAHIRHDNESAARFICTDNHTELADYSVASGLFNVRLNSPDNEWLEYIKDMLDRLNQTSRFGFSFNCLTSYSDADKMQNHLYYANPCHLFDYCKQQYSRDVALLHDYGLYEFTILVRKSPPKMP